MIGTPGGVVKCRTVNRLSREHCWDATMIHRMRGVPWEVVPGRPGVAVPVEIQDNGEVMTGEEDHDEYKEPIDEEGTPEMKFKGGPDKLHVSRKAIEKNGPTEGCPACSIIKRRGHLRGRVGTTTTTHAETESNI